MKKNSMFSFVVLAMATRGGSDMLISHESLLTYKSSQKQGFISVFIATINKHNNTIIPKYTCRYPEVDTWHRAVKYTEKNKTKIKDKEKNCPDLVQGSFSSRVKNRGISSLAKEILHDMAVALVSRSV